MLRFNAPKNFCPDVDFFLNMLRKEIPFQFCKLNHAFWDAALTLVKEPNLVPQDVPVWRPEGWFYFHGIDFMREMSSVIKDIPNTKILLAASEKAAPGIVVHNRNSDTELRQFILSCFPKNYILFYGPLLKKYAINHTLEKILQYIAKYNDVLIVGLSHTLKFKNYFEFRKFFHLELDLYLTTRDRFSVLQKIKSVVTTMNSPVILFQAGESLSLWFIYQLQKISPHITMIDMGRSLDAWCLLDGDAPKSLPDMKNQLWKNLLR